MLEYWIADLISDVETFSVPCSVGTWEFIRRYDYTERMEEFESGMCVPTYTAGNTSIGPGSSDEDYSSATGDLIDICLILSFVGGTCVAPKGTSELSEITTLALGDAFIRPRAIRGFDPLKIDVASLFAAGLPAVTQDFKARRMRLFLSHWISGLTCFSLEDLFLLIGVQMDIVKQCEIVATGMHLSYFKGMTSASQRYGIPALNSDFKAARNDIVHEGRLSGFNFPSKTKQDCVIVTVDALNWIDAYVCRVLNMPVQGSNVRWKTHAIELPALSFHA